MKSNFFKLRKKFFIVCLSLLLSSCVAVKYAVGSKGFTIIGTSDLHGNLESIKINSRLTGGKAEGEQTFGVISRIATLIRNIKEEKKGQVAVVSCGDDLMNRYFHTYKGTAIFRLMSMAGYDFYAFGNHEFDKGPKILSKALKVSDFQCICSDLKVKGTSLEGLCQPWLIRDYNGLKVGFFSLMTEDFPFVTSGKEVELISNNIETAFRASKELRKKGAEIVVGLTHIGYKKDCEIAKSVPEIDIIFGAHSHEYLPSFAKVGNTIIVNGGEKGSFLVRLDVEINQNGRINHDKTNYRLIPVTIDIHPDVGIDALLESYQQSFPEAIILGQTEVEWDLSKKALRQGEASIANLINDLMREKFHADIVLNNAGAFRGNKKFQPGSVTDTMLREIDEFGNYAFTLDIKGIYIKEILERSAAGFGKGGLLHPSGLRYSIDLKKQAQKISTDNPDQLNVIVKGERVRDIQVLGKDEKWERLDQKKTYRILSNSYLVNHQGDGYFWFKRYGKNLNNTYSTFYSILAEFVENNRIMNPGSLDKRLTVLQ